MQSGAPYIDMVVISVYGQAFISQTYVSMSASHTTHAGKHKCNKRALNPKWQRIRVMNMCCIHVHTNPPSLCSHQCFSHS